LAALLVAAAGDQSAAQSNAGHSLSARNVSRLAPAETQIREPATGQTTGQATGQASAGTTHRRSWRDLARSKSDGQTDKPPATLSPWSAAGALAVVVGLILVLARLFRRHAPMFQQALPQEALEILGRRHVDPRQTILLVRIGSRILVIGSSASGLNSLGEIADPVEVDLLAGLCRRDPHTGVLGTSFFKLLKGESLQRPTPAAARSGPIRSAPIRAATGAPQSAAPDPILDGPSNARPLESPPDGRSQPEYDLMRRLRGAPAARHAERAEGVL
jgi:flagellar biogenesis protein FliO